MRNDSITKLTLIKNDDEVFNEGEKLGLQYLHESILEGDEEELRPAFSPLHVVRQAHITVEQLKCHAATFELSDLDGVVDLNDDDPNNHNVTYLRILVLMNISIGEMMSDIDNFKQEAIH